MNNCVVHLCCCCEWIFEKFKRWKQQQIQANIWQVLYVDIIILTMCLCGVMLTYTLQQFKSPQKFVFILLWLNGIEVYLRAN